MTSRDADPAKESCRGDSELRPAYPIEIRLLEIRGRGTCPFGVQLGDLFRSDGQIGAVCHWAAHTLLSWTTAVRSGGDVPWESEPGLARVCCPDPDNVVVFEVGRRAVESQQTADSCLSGRRASRRSEANA